MFLVTVILPENLSLVSEEDQDQVLGGNGRGVSLGVRLSGAVSVKRSRADGHGLCHVAC